MHVCSAGQISEFAADRDREGNRLRSDCTYVLKAGAGALPRWWSVAAFASASGEQPGLVSARTAVTEKDGSLVIAISATPQPGNWLAAPQAREFALLYSGTESRGLAESATKPAPFSIDKKGC